jgi:hypothetical protein
MATAQPVHDRLRDTISRLVHRGLGVEDYWRAVSDALDGAVPSEGSCLMTMLPRQPAAASGNTKGQVRDLAFRVAPTGFEPALPP